MRMTALVLVCLTLAPAAQAAVAVEGELDRRIVKAFLEQADGVAKRVNPDACRRELDKTPENYCWNLSSNLHQLLVAYELTGDVRYLDDFATVFENMRSTMRQGPDGFLGWYGPPLPNFRHPQRPDQQVDVLITSFRVTERVCQFLILTGDEPALRRRFAEQRKTWLDLVRNHLVRKWVVRGNYVSLGARGAVFRSHASLAPAQARLTLPHNKQSIAATALLKLYRVTGEPTYLEMAVRLGTRFKHCLTLRKGRYAWNYWDPAGSWDIHPEDPKSWKTWVGPEHKGAYFAETLRMVVALYQHDLVFNEQDLQRFLRTQTEVVWNGKTDWPVWHCTDGKQIGEGDYIAPALAAYDQRVARYLFEGDRQVEQERLAAHPYTSARQTAPWLEAKYLTVPKVRHEAQPHADLVEQAQLPQEQKQILLRLQVQVKGRGYEAPAGPAALNSPVEKEVPAPAADTRSEDQPEPPTEAEATSTSWDGWRPLNAPDNEPTEDPDWLVPN